MELVRLNTKDDKLLKFMAVLYRDIPEKFWEGNMEFIEDFKKEVVDYLTKNYHA